MSSSEVLAEPLEPEQKAGRPRGLIALFGALAVCMIGVAIFFVATGGRRSINQGGSQGAATPGEYASDRSRWVSMGLVAETLIFPGGDIRW